MTAATVPSIMDRPTADEAREELRKFFTIAAMADHAPGMFSRFIDAEWHRLAETPDYPEFCTRSVGRMVTHAPINGEGQVHWVGTYHRLFGALPAAWFADENGVVDTEAMGAYIDTHTVTASWNCVPTTGDGDGGKSVGA